MIRARPCDECDLEYELVRTVAFSTISTVRSSIEALDTPALSSACDVSSDRVVETALLSSANRGDARNLCSSP